jgi:hypothetical protein
VCAEPVWLSLALLIRVISEIREDGGDYFGNAVRYKTLSWASRRTFDPSAMSELNTSSTVKEKLRFNVESVEQGDVSSLAVYSTIQNQGSKEWLLASDIPERPVC